MTTSALPPLSVALVGNPNSGKTTLFNRLTQRQAKVANYPGVTVEKIAGTLHTSSGRAVSVVDLPGAYSLTAHSPEEQIVCDTILGRVADTPPPQVLVAVVDASNLQRNLYLVEQLREMKVPLVVALNMIDIAERRGLKIMTAMLATGLGVRVFPMDAHTGRGVDALAAHLDTLDVSTDVEAAPPDPDPTLIPERYRRIEAVCAEAVEQPAHRTETRSERMDHVLTHRVLGPLIFLMSMALVFISIFFWAKPLMDLIDTAMGGVAWLAETALPAGVVRDLITGGVIAGVGNVVIFLPQIVILFLFLALLEDSGYMARAAFIMDRMMKGIGLSGRSFIPLLGSFACAVPGIMATRTVVSRRARLATILIAPLMSCSARLPVYTLVTAAFFPNPITAGLVVFSMYLLGIAAAVATAFLVKRVIFRSPDEPFLMELPPYRLPSLRNVLITVRGHAMDFLRRAGTVILALTIILWALMQFPALPAASAVEFDARRATLIEQRASGADVGDALARLAVEENSAALSHSAAGKLGHVIEPLVRPLGFDWKIGVGLIASFAAREVFVSTLGVVYRLDEDVALDEPLTVAEVMLADTWPDGRPIFTPLVGIGILVFFVLALQCGSTIAVVHRETHGWKWPLVQFLYMTTLAYLAALIIQQGGQLLGPG